jgi:hypothetical protein
MNPVSRLSLGARGELFPGNDRTHAGVWGDGGLEVYSLRDGDCLADRTARGKPRAGGGYCYGAAGIGPFIEVGYVSAEAAAVVAGGLRLRAPFVAGK